jgi:predicted PurR-regulated permease PerM
MTRRASLEKIAMNESNKDDGSDSTIASISRTSVANGFIIAAILAGMLYFGRDVLVPISLAVILSFILAPVVRLLQRTLLPKALCVIVVVALTFSLLLALGAIMAGQLGQLGTELPRYETNLREKIRSLKLSTIPGGKLDDAANVLKDLNQEIEKSETNQKSTATEQARPIPVEVRNPEPGPLSTLLTLITPLLSPLAATGIVILFVIFILLQREDLRNRLIRLAGAHDLPRTTAALNDAASRLSRLYLAQLIVNCLFGAVIGLGLWLIGVPGSLLWGILAAILRFVPYIGAVLSAVFPLLLAAAVGPNWTMLLWTAGLYLVAEPLVGQFIEPLAFGHIAGLSPVAVVASAIIWTTLWGPIGLVLSTPLTICLVVMGRHIEAMKFLDILFGDEPALTPEQTFYQRMLVGDPVEVIEQANNFIKDTDLFHYLDEVAIPGLLLAHVDAESGALSKHQISIIAETFAEMLDDIDTRAEAENSKFGAGEKPPLPLHTVVVPAPGGLNYAGALAFGAYLLQGGISNRCLDTNALSVARTIGLDLEGIDTICICYLVAPSMPHHQYLLRRLQRKAAAARIIAIAWSGDVPDKGVILSPADGLALLKHRLETTDGKIPLEQGGQ